MKPPSNAFERKSMDRKRIESLAVIVSEGRGIGKEVSFPAPADAGFEKTLIM
jgi:electron transfer flavoprotein alpha subunit